LVFGCNTSNEKTTNHKTSNDSINPVTSERLTIDKKIIYDSTFHDYHDTTFVYNGVSTSIRIDSSTFLTRIDTSSYLDSIIVKTKQAFDQIVTIDSGQYQISFQLSTLNLKYLSPKRLPSFKYLRMNEINRYSMFQSSPDKLLLLFKGKELMLAKTSEYVSKSNNEFFFNNLVINFNTNEIINSPEIEKIAKIKHPFLESAHSVNDSTVLLFYFGTDPSNSRQSIAICSYDGENIKYIVKSEVLNHSIIHTLKGPNRSIFLSGSAGTNYIINHDDLSAVKLEYQEYNGEDYLEKIAAGIFPVSLLTIYTDSLIENYRITTDNNPENLPW